MEHLAKRPRRQSKEISIGENEVVSQVSKLTIKDNPIGNSSPMNINLIVMVILNHLQLPDLKNCRLVCSDWNHTAVQVLISRNGLQVSFTKSKYVAKMTQQQLLIPIKNYTEVMRKCPKIPYFRYLFEGVSFRNPAVKNFFRICGHNIKHLSISIPKKHYLDVKAFSNLLTEFAPKLETLNILQFPAAVFEADNLQLPSSAEQLQLPNLKALTFPDYPGVPSGLDRKFGNIWKQIFVAATNLEKIECHVLELLYGDDPDEAVARLEFRRDFVKTLKDSRKMATLTKLRFEHLNSSDVQQLCTGALEQGMALTEFRVGTLTDKEAKEAIEKFLSIQSNFLKRLSIGNEDSLFGWKFGITFPVMTQLLSFTFMSTRYDENPVLIENVDLVKTFPRLISLHIGSNLLKSAFHLQPSLIHPGVKNLGFDFDMDSPLVVKTLGKMFPSVTSLQYFNACHSKLQAVWTTFPHVKELFVSINNEYCSSKRGLDEAFGTYSVEMKEMIPELNKNLANVPVIRELLYPSILEMEGLETLTINCSLTNRVLTDASGIFLFANLKALRALEIKNSQITKHCEELLKTKIPDLRLLEADEEEDIDFGVSDSD